MFILVAKNLTKLLFLTMSFCIVLFVDMFAQFSENWFSGVEI